MSGVAVNVNLVNVKMDESQSSWMTDECKRHRNIGNRNKAKRIYTPNFPVATNNMYDVLLNLMDYPSSREEVASEMQENITTKKKLKTHCDTENAQPRHYIKHCVYEAPKKVNNQYRHKPVNAQEDNTKPKNIPTVINGCVFPSKNGEIFPYYDFISELFVKLVNSKSTSSESSKHNILLIGDSHLRGYSENINLHLNDQFQVTGYIKPGADTKTILEQVTKDIENLLAKDFIILCCGSNDIGRIKLSMVYHNVINFIKRVSHTKVIL
jgi:hypothetical protein